MEEIVKAEREYLVNVLHKKLIDSEEQENRTGIVVNGKLTRGYVVLAMKYWSEEFSNNKHPKVHHINFDHTDNRVSNLVVLTHDEHMLIHRLFDPKYSIRRKHMSDARKGKSPWNKGLTKETDKRVAQYGETRKKNNQT